MSFHKGEEIFLGKQLLGELYTCSSTYLNDPEAMKSIMEEAANYANATIVQSVFHHFSPHGVSGVVVIQESHFAVHTWPEHQFVSVDFYTCGATAFPEKAMEFLVDKLNAKQFDVKEVDRGHLSKIQEFGNINK
ncbi:adenosylmethionine decarboxylase [Flammeovirga yaeyamensis]|uniref:S-adenosylmethionine decarboxylase proenzyme n=1 Tax=Flammeovirga yaeyamensis TaxID=367791 RepID=A0AAX1MZF8_9BACT|nr:MULTISPECIES: adenosylmethionine decarboxylase [Flammeovirga]ANQ47934.1 adenosylmethionine decarboxylase [Flammeovirga sp. MY04]MBB3700903.1 S-adenosylmethionine decarboxylase [Flammeovirga yaeyamensis]NMF38011.1 adenosylmethionine decarboxylase [Flammeovirga yaeyamensis]QWG00661.1 adenosylmethionine decarboxylase [Flammeovirga yaeyamensis]